MEKEEEAKVSKLMEEEDEAPRVQTVRSQMIENEEDTKICGLMANEDEEFE